MHHIALIPDAYDERREVVVYDADGMPILSGRVTFWLGRYAIKGYDLYDDMAGELIDGLTFAYREEVPNMDEFGDLLG